MSKSPQRLAVTSSLNPSLLHVQRRRSRRPSARAHTPRAPHPSRWLFALRRGPGPFRPPRPSVAPFAAIVPGGGGGGGGSEQRLMAAGGAATPPSPAAQPGVLRGGVRAKALLRRVAQQRVQQRRRGRGNALGPTLGRPRLCPALRASRVSVQGAAPVRASWRSTPADQQSTAQPCAARACSSGAA